MKGMTARRAAPILKSRREIRLMREAGRIVHQVLERAGAMVRPGVTTGELNAEAERLIAEAGGIALFKGVRNPQAKFPFPAALCTSANEQVVHGVPGDRMLAEGDVLSIDCGVRRHGYCGDAAMTFAVGRVPPAAQRLLDVARGALELAVAEIRPGRRWSTVAARMQRLVEDAGFSVVREFVGHGIGQEMHEEPKVANYADRGQRRGDFELRPGLVIAVEPMVTAGGPEVKAGDRTGWPIVTRDGSLAAHFEHTIAVTADGCEVLTDGM
jgi:methionyl aminopeptidase